MKTVPTVLFVALDEIPSLGWLPQWVDQAHSRPVKIDKASSLDGLPATFASSPPALILLPASGRRSGSLLEGLLQCCPLLRATVIGINIRTPNEALAIFEWSSAGGGYGSRSSSLAQLQLEIRSAVERAAVPAELAAKLLLLGFYDCLPSPEGQLHVQTEVAGKDELRIRSTVVRDGAVLDAVTQQWPHDVRDLTSGTDLVKAQHDQILALATGRAQPAGAQRR